jgi:quinol monooxygenase YgiN
VHVQTFIVTVFLMLTASLPFSAPGAVANSLDSAAVQAPPPAAPPVPEGPRTIVTYVEIAPTSEAQGLALLKAYRDATRRDAGNLDAQVWQRTGVRGHFVVIERWQDETARKNHREGAHVSQFLDKLTPLRISSYDERTHTDFNAGKSAPVAANAVLVVTHVDITPPGLPKARELLQGQGTNSRGEAGNLRFDVLQGARQNHFTVLEAWRDESAREAHITGTHTRSAREGLREQSVDGAPYDERLYRLAQ